MSEFDAFQGLPWEPVPGRGTAKLTVNVQVPRVIRNEDEEETAKPKEYTVKGFRISPKDFESIGHTPLCPGCRAIIMKQPAQSHSKICRERVEKELTKAGDSRISDAYERFRIFHEERQKKAGTALREEKGEE